MASSPFSASPEDDVAAFVIDKTTLSACMRIRWGGVGVVEAPIADRSLADGLFWPSPSSGICMTGTSNWRRGGQGSLRSQPPDERTLTGRGSWVYPNGQGSRVRPGRGRMCAPASPRLALRACSSGFALAARLIPFLTQPPHERTQTGRGSRVYPKGRGSWVYPNGRGSW